MMRSAYQAEDLRSIENALRQAMTPHCPGCGSRLTSRPIKAPTGLSYVRHRLWVQCPSCRRSATVEIPK